MAAPPTPAMDPQQWLTAVVEHAELAILSKRLDGRILTWNSAAEVMYGYTAEEVVGQYVSVLMPEDRKGEMETILSRLSAGERIHHFETCRRRKDGQLLDVSLSISPVRDDDGAIVGAATIARDITSRRKARAELKRLNDEIELQRLRVFKATMRTVQDIVNNLLNGLQLVQLEAEGEPAEMQSQVDGVIREAATKLKALGDLETIKEKEMAAGLGIDYPGAPF